MNHKLPLALKLGLKVKVFLNLLNKYYFMLLPQKLKGKLLFKCYSFHFNITQTDMHVCLSLLLVNSSTNHVVGFFLLAITQTDIPSDWSCVMTLYSMSFRVFIQATKAKISL